VRDARGVNGVNGEGCFARYINLILWIPDRWWKEEARSGEKSGGDGVSLARFEYS